MTSKPITAADPVLVAVDGSAESLAALRWAIDHAHALRRELRILTAFEPGNAPTSDSAVAYIDEIERAERQARDRVRDALDIEFAFEGFRFEHVVVLGPIERVLADFSETASLVVVGTRARGNWLQRLFQRSATDRLTGSLACPVVSVGLDAESSARANNYHSPARL